MKNIRLFITHCLGLGMMFSLSTIPETCAMSSNLLLCEHLLFRYLRQLLKTIWASLATTRQQFWSLSNVLLNSVEILMGFLYLNIALDLWNTCAGYWLNRPKHHTSHKCCTMWFQKARNLKGKKIETESCDYFNVHKKLMLHHKGCKNRLRK